MHSNGVCNERCCTVANDYRVAEGVVGLAFGMGSGTWLCGFINDSIKDV